MDTRETSLDKSSFPLQTGHTCLNPQAPCRKQGRFLFLKAHICRDGPNPELKRDITRCRANMETKGLFSHLPLLSCSTRHLTTRDTAVETSIDLLLGWFEFILKFHLLPAPSAREKKTVLTRTCSHLEDKKLSQMGLWFQRNTFSLLWKVWHSPTQFTSTTAPRDTWDVELKDWEVKMEKTKEILENEKRRADVLTFKTTSRDTNETTKADNSLDVHLKRRPVCKIFQMRSAKVEPLIFGGLGYKETLT